MPDSYGHARDFFDPAVKDGGMNKPRGLLQFTNPSGGGPMVGDLVVWEGWKGNPYGHVAIVASVDERSIEVVQQNTGSTRTRIKLKKVDDRWRVDHDRIMGWLRKEK